MGMAKSFLEKTDILAPDQVAHQRGVVRAHPRAGAGGEGEGAGGGSQ